MTGDPSLEPTLWDEGGAPETVYLTRVPDLTTDDGWLVPSVDVGSWRPLEVGDRVVALDKRSPDEFVVEVVAARLEYDEVYYAVRHLADLDPAAEPGLDSTRTWLPGRSGTAEAPLDAPRESRASSRVDVTGLR